MATPKSGRGPRGGDYRKREYWSGINRDYKSGSSSPGPRRNNYNRSDSPRGHREYAQKIYVQYLSEEWKKVEQDLHKEPTKDSKVTHTVEYIEKNPVDIKAEELFDMGQYLKNRKEKQLSGE